jgi:hypothetical protein
MDDIVDGCHSVVVLQRYHFSLNGVRSRASMMILSSTEWIFRLIEVYGRVI